MATRIGFADSPEMMIMLPLDPIALPVMVMKQQQLGRKEKNGFIASEVMMVPDTDTKTKAMAGKMSQLDTYLFGLESYSFMELSRSEESIGFGGSMVAEILQL